MEYTTDRYCIFKMEMVRTDSSNVNKEVLHTDAKTWYDNDLLILLDLLGDKTRLYGKSAKGSQVYPLSCKISQWNTDINDYIPLFSYSIFNEDFSPSNPITDEIFTKKWVSGNGKEIDIFHLAKELNKLPFYVHIKDTDQEDKIIKGIITLQKLNEIANALLTDEVLPYNRDKMLFVKNRRNHKILQGIELLHEYEVDIPQEIQLGSKLLN